MTTLLSNLIKKEHHRGFKIEAFRVEEFEAQGHSGDGKANSLAPSDKTIDDRLSRIEMEAYEKGFEQGQKDGLIMGQKRLDEAAKRLDALIRSLSELKSKILKESEEEIVKLAIEIARKIVRRELQTDPEAVLRTIRQAISHVNDRSTVRILLNPDDMEKVKEVLPELRAEKKIDRVELIENTRVERGGCIIETGFGMINATIEDQLALISEELEEELNGKGQEDGIVS